MKVSTRATCGSFIVDQRGTILGFDQAMERLTGWPAIDVVGRNKALDGPIGDEQRPAAGPLFEGDVPRPGQHRNLGLIVNCRDGRQLEVEALVEPLPRGGDQTLVTVLRVVSLSATRGASGDAERFDPLTLLPNSAAFRATLEADFVAASGTARPIALILADVDHLRALNDRLGHAAGDEVLQKLAGILRVSVADEGRVFRLADDDFAILLPDAGRGEARQQAASLRSTVERHRFFDEPLPDDARVTLSLGAASFPADADNPTDLLERACEALQEARALGRNRVWCYVRRPRVPIHVPVYFDGTDSLLVGYSRDLSPSGIFVQTSAPIEIGMRCALTFPLPGHDSRVHVIGRVVRAVPPETSHESHAVRIPGMGVEFERFGGPGDRRAIDAFLHRNEARTLRPEDGRFSIRP